MTSPSNYLPAVRDQYEAFPYPPRNPEDERRHLRNSFFDFLELINFYCYNGRNSFADHFRVLVAGGGTGDETIFLAEQLRHANAQVVHLDISVNSMKVAQQRAQMRNLKNITWVHHSLLELPELDLGKFDYINCIGVLMALKDPAAGLRALKSALKPSGAMMIMLYGLYGRTGVYQMQKLMRKVNAPDADMRQKIENAKAILRSAPKTNWFKRGEDLFQGLAAEGDSGIYDMFLHSQDVAHSVDDVYDLVEGCGMRIIELVFPGRFKYMVETYVSDPQLREQLLRLPRREQQAIAELLAGDFTHHFFYATHADNASTVASLDDLDNVPFFFLWPPPDIFDWLEKNPGKPISIRTPLGASVHLDPAKHTKLIFKYLDGERSLRAIFDLVRRKADLPKARLPDKELLDEFRPMFEALNALPLMLLRGAKVGKFRSLDDMQRDAMK